MKHSIRYRIALLCIGLMTLMLLSIWFINNWWLESYYINNKLGALENAYNSVDELVMLNASEGKNILGYEELYRTYDSEMESDVVELVRILRDKSNIASVIIDSVTGEVLLSSVMDGKLMAEKVQHYIIGRGVPRVSVLKAYDNYTIQRSFDMRSKAFNLESWGYFSDNRTVFIMSTPLASIRESVMLSNRFLAYVGLSALLISCAVLYFSTQMITRPILNLAKLSEKMSNLDFDAKYTDNAEDEIGVLGHSMNVLSDKLRITIGELKSANNELQKDIEEKIRIDETRKDFIANVSHELKTPIALIQGYAEGLSEGMCEDKESRDYYCEVILDEANKMNKMVRQLLNLTALEFGNDAPVMERFDVVELIRGVVTSARILIQAREAEVILERTEPVYVWADEFKIEEVITNYLNNALNHVDEHHKIIIDIEDKEGEAKISVFNTGKHIPEDDIENLWVKFFKVDKARTREYGGSGIGLSIVKAIIESHHKGYGVENVEDGVRFWFTLDTDTNFV